MLLDERRYAPFSDPNWLYEIKYDGYRMLAQFGVGPVYLRTRQGQDCTRWFPEVVGELSKYGGGPYIIDGEVTVLDEEGRSDFDRLQDRARRRKYYEGADPVIYCVFDLLVAGKSLMDLPLELRKSLLASLFTPAPTHSVLVVEAIPQRGLDLYSLAEKLKLEGLTAKLADSLYLPGVRSDAWRKLKRPGAIPPERFRRS